MDVVRIRKQREMRHVSAVLFMGAKKGRVLKKGVAAIWVRAGRVRISSSQT